MKRGKVSLLNVRADGRRLQSMHRSVGVGGVSLSFD